VWIIDSKVYIRAFNDRDFGAELTRFHAAHLPRIILSAVVVFELLAACRNANTERRLRRGLVQPYQSRGRIHVPNHTTWEMAAHLDQPEGTIKSRIRAGLTRLRRDLLAAGITLGGQP